MSTLIFIYRSFWEHLTVWPILAGPVVLAVGISANSRIKTASRWLNWSPFNVKSNIALLPLRTRIWAIYLAIFVAIIPLAALIEELAFRAPSHPIIKGILWGSLAFGFMHLTSLVSVRMCLYLAAIGLLFVGVYDIWGLWVVWTLHTSYNLSAVALVVHQKMGAPPVPHKRRRQLVPLH